MKEPRQKKVFALISDWILSQLVQLKTFRMILDLAMVITIIGLLLAVVSFYRSELSNKKIIETLNKIIDGQREMLEIIRTGGKLPPELTGNITDFPSSHRPSSIYQIEVTEYFIEVNPPQIEVKGNLFRQTEFDRYWIGILSGLQLWPQILLTEKIQNNQTFEYRLPVPVGVKTGAVVLLSVGESTDNLFVGYQDYAVKNLNDVGIYFPNISDTMTMASDEFNLMGGEPNDRR